MAEKILIVDDDLDTLRLVGLMLQHQGYRIVAASSGLQAIALCQSEKPDMVLLDIMMPEMDGYEVARKLRSDPATNSLPIIMFTAKTQVDDKIQGFEVGADDYLTKPTQPRELFAHVKAVLARGKKPSAVVPPTVQSRSRGYVTGVMAVKGGLGISTLALNVGISLQARSKKNVIIAEFRPGQGSMALDLGYLNPEGLPNLLQLPAEKISPELIEGELYLHKSGVRLLPSSYDPGNAKYLTAVDHFEAIARYLAYMAAHVVIDLGPGLSPITDRTLAYCDEVIVVLEPIPNTIIRTLMLVEELAKKGFGEGRVNTVLYNRQRTEMQYSLAQVQMEFRHPISIVFTAAPELAYQCSKANVPLVIQHPDNLTSQQFAKLADNITKRVRSKE
jgi:CheY-like chemotaxis protein/MinD-like ATPase involved in chromosome partitioning or flagellar assembly